MMRVTFPDSNEIEVKGNKFFVANVFQLIVPIMQDYGKVHDWNSIPVDPDWLRVELQMAQDAAKQGKPFDGKFVQYQIDEADAARAVAGE